MSGKLKFFPFTWQLGDCAQQSSRGCLLAKRGGGRSQAGGLPVGQIAAPACFTSCQVGQPPPGQACTHPSHANQPQLSHPGGWGILREAHFLLVQHGGEVVGCQRLVAQV